MQLAKAYRADLSDIHVVLIVLCECPMINVTHYQKHSHERLLHRAFVSPPTPCEAVPCTSVAHVTSIHHSCGTTLIC